MLEVRLIGKFEIQYDGKAVILSSRAAQSLFAYLILTTGTLHRREKLAGMLWPDESEQKARTYLRNELWRIRKALSLTSKVEYLLADNLTVGANPAAVYWLDVAALKNMSDNVTIDEMTAGLSHYQGELLPGFYEDWVVLEREHLLVLFEQKVAGLLEMLEKEHRWQEMLGWAERWISLSQAPEAAYQALMVAYDALEDHSKVTSTYERCKQALRQLDLEPSEEIRALAFKQSSRIKVPISLTSFVGREKELREVSGLLSKSRLVTLTGAGGVGKTRLATQVVAEVLELFPDGVWFLDLAPLSEPALVPIALASLIGFHEIMDTKSPITHLLIRSFGSGAALVIFDNCEHLIMACAKLVDLLLTSCPNLSVLATSREALRIAGEVPYRVPSLEIPRSEVEFTIDESSKMESVKLFAERAAVTSPGFAIHPQNVAAIARICQRLDGIPLAIELAAARINMLTLQQILNRLDDRFNLLTDGMRTALPRQQTLRATIDWSYNLLPEKERILFRRLAVFTGGWTLDAAEKVCSGDGIGANDVLDLLSQLVNKSLVLVEAGNLETRYRRLETIREFAREKLIEATEAGRLQNRHLAYFLKKAEEIVLDPEGKEAVTDLFFFDRELDNIRLALEWSIAARKGEEAFRLFSALGSFWLAREYFQEGTEWFQRASTLKEGATRGTQAKALRYAGSLYFMQENFPASSTVLRESLEIYRELGDTHEISKGLQLMEILETGQQNFLQGRLLLEERLGVDRP